SMMLAPIGVQKPYYVVDIDSTTKAWTAKFVFVAANAWDADQATWLSQTLAQKTTYTFVVRHEGSQIKNTPGVTPSNTIILQYPRTMLIVGHSHRYEYSPKNGELTVGN